MTVHKADCTNVSASEQERMVEVSWAETGTGAAFNASVHIIAYDHVSLLGELAMCIGNMDIPIVAVSAKRDEKKKTSVITMVVSGQRAGAGRTGCSSSFCKRSDIIEVYRARRLSRGSALHPTPRP